MPFYLIGHVSTAELCFSVLVTSTMSQALKRVLPRSHTKLGTVRLAPCFLSSSSCYDVVSAAETHLPLPGDAKVTPLLPVAFAAPFFGRKIHLFGVCHAPSRFGVPIGHGGAGGQHSANSLLPAAPGTDHTNDGISR